MTTSHVYLTPEIPMELLMALHDSADQTGCDADLIVVSSIDLAAVLRAAGIEVHFELPDNASALKDDPRRARPDLATTGYAADDTPMVYGRVDALAAGRLSEDRHTHLQLHSLLPDGSQCPECHYLAPRAGNVSE